MSDGEGEGERGDRGGGGVRAGWVGVVCPRVLQDKEYFPAVSTVHTRFEPKTSENKEALATVGFKIK